MGGKDYCGQCVCVRVCQSVCPSFCPLDNCGSSKLEMWEFFNVRYIKFGSREANGSEERMTATVSVH